ncbi:MAG: hypothetical protein QOJ65_1107, partial [Fimbriimonadaceae bacterium]|nr:hypothetical protein [Fimbriimonadaceae bacterium]
MTAALVVTFLLLSPPQMQMDHGAGKNPPPKLRSGLGKVHHPVSTSNRTAQSFFNQGLALTYGFNHHAALRCFEEAARLDPQLAMAHWGIAYAMGPNINMPIDPDTCKQAYAEVQKAIALKAHASPAEVAMIDALALRYSGDDKPDFEKLNKAYAAAMKEVAKQYPSDLNIQALYAESLMDLRPWRYWNSDGTPAEDTEEIVAVLQGVLKKDPNHIAANHFLIHAVEASPHPELALESARRLETLAPESGHLVHMPSHIYIRTGDWVKGVESNDAAIKVDKSFLKHTPDPGVYPMYYVHNYDMLRSAADMQGNYMRSIWAAQNVADKAATMGPMGEPLGIVPILTQIRFRKWDQLLIQPQPKTSLPFAQAVWRLGRGMAMAAQGGDKADAEFALYREERDKVPAEFTWGLGPASKVLAVFNGLAEASLARLKGDASAEVSALKKAVAAYDEVGYDEPPDVFYPVRESFGGALLRSKRYAEAEAVFREDLKRHPNSGRDLFGIWKALEGAGKAEEAEAAKREYQKSWL